MQFKLADMAVEIEACLLAHEQGGRAQGRGQAIRPGGGDREALHRRVQPRRQCSAPDPRRRPASWTSSPSLRLYRDQKILEIGEGNDQVQRMVIAKHLGLDPAGPHVDLLGMDWHRIVTTQCQALAVSTWTGPDFKKYSGSRWYVAVSMYLRQFVDDDLGCASYLIGDEEAGEAVGPTPSMPSSRSSTRPSTWPSAITPKTHMHG